MARLFITPREIDFINDINKELTKDVIGQTVVLYLISEVKTKVHDVYKESPNKIFEKPVRISALVEWEPQDIRTNEFGTEEYTSVTALIQSRDLIDKEIQVSEGDFFSYGAQFFEVTAARTTHNVYGQIEFSGGVQLIGKEARRSNFITKLRGPTDEKYSDKDAVQDKFYQQRGFDMNAEGPTGDVRDLQQRGVLDAPLTGPGEVSPLGTLTGSANSSFYEDQ